LHKPTCCFCALSDSIFCTSDFTALPGSENGSLNQGSESLTGSDDINQSAFIGHARHRGDGQDVDTSSSSTQLVLVSLLICIN
jgi:hypothetical protein